ncbi:MAG: hypothetical protein ACI837_003343 [Crocinitomicaceae bacterium]|jgi:hypothetical protein
MNRKSISRIVSLSAILLFFGACAVHPITEEEGAARGYNWKKVKTVKL